MGCCHSKTATKGGSGAEKIYNVRPVPARQVPAKARVAKAPQGTHGTGRAKAPQGTHRTGGATQKSRDREQAAQHNHYAWIEEAKRQWIRDMERVARKRAAAEFKEWERWWTFVQQARLRQVNANRKNNGMADSSTSTSGCMLGFKDCQCYKVKDFGPYLYNMKPLGNDFPCYRMIEDKVKKTFPIPPLKASEQAAGPSYCWPF